MILLLTSSLAWARFDSPLVSMGWLLAPEGSRQFGQALAGAGDVDDNRRGDLLVGAPGSDGGGTARGRAHLYLALDDNTGLPPTPSWTVEGPADGARFGGSLAGGGDIDGDGFDDLLIGCTGTSWWVALYAGGWPSPEPEPLWAFDGGGGSYGHALAIPGDMDGDGYAEMAIGAAGYGLEGEVHVHPGGATGPGSAWVLSASDGVGVGSLLAPGGDLDGDGLPDLLTASSTATGNAIVRLIVGGAAGPRWAEGSWRAPAGTAGFGVSLAGGGDLDGDGRADLFVGADGSGSNDGLGRVIGFWGAAGGPLTTADVNLADTRPNTLLGRALLSPGDLNGDGIGDLLVGRPAWGTSGAPEGGAVVFLGGPDGPVRDESWLGEGPSGGADGWSGYGHYLGAIGDLDGDLHADVAIGAPEVGDGRVEVLRGRDYQPSEAPTDTGEPQDTGREPEPSSGRCSCQAGPSLAPLLLAPLPLLRRRRR